MTAPATVTALEVDSTGRLAAVAYGSGASSTVEVFSLLPDCTAESVITLDGHGGAILDLEFDDSDSLFTVDARGGVRSWEWDTALHRTLSSGVVAPSGLAFSRAGVLGITDASGGISVIDESEREIRSRYAVQRRASFDQDHGVGWTSSGEPAGRIGFAPDGRRVASLWKGDRWQETAASEPTAIAVGPEGSVIIATAAGRLLRVDSFGRTMTEISVGTPPVDRLVSAQDGALVIGASHGLPLRAWSGHDLRPREIACVPTDPPISRIQTLSADSRGRHIVVAGSGRVSTCRGSGQELTDLSFPIRPSASDFVIATTSTDGELVAAALPSELVVWDSETRRVIARYPLASLPTAIAISPDRETIALASSTPTGEEGRVRRLPCPHCVQDFERLRRGAGKCVLGPLSAGELPEIDYTPHSRWHDEGAGCTL